MPALDTGEIPNGKVELRARHYRTGVVERFTFEGGRLHSRQRTREDDSDVELVFGPGFVDLQCNGYAGIDFNHPDTTPQQIEHALRVMWSHGCTVVLPTVITAAGERLEHLLTTLITARSSPEIRRSVPGFHVEGPFISGVDGARGAHPRTHVRAPDWEFFTRLRRAAEDLILMLTLAPESDGALPFIEQLRDANVIPAIGHTLADAQIVAAAANAGAMVSTHLGNGCPQLMDRHRNPIFAQLGESRLAATVIPDGVHLPDELLYSISQVKGQGKTLVVTDAMAGAGAPPGAYTLAETALEVGEDRIVRQPGSSYFAGSALTMNEAVVKFHQATGHSLTDAWDAASKQPARLLCAGGAVHRIDPGTIIARVGERQLDIQATFRGKNVLWLDREVG